MLNLEQFVFISLVLVIILLDLFLGYCYANFSSSIVNIPFVVDNYSTKYGYEYKNMSYSVEQYNSETGKMLINDNKYIIVGDNVDKIKDNIGNSINYINDSEYINIVFYFNNISSNDYYLIIENENLDYLHCYARREKLYIFSIMM